MAFVRYTVARLLALIQANTEAKEVSDDSNYMIDVKSMFAIEEHYRETTDFVRFTGSMSAMLRE